MALITMQCLDKDDVFPTLTERSEMVADVTPQGHAPWLRRLLLQSTEDDAEGALPLPWLPPTLTHEDITVPWFSSGSQRSIRHNRTLSFCPGAILDGKPQPFVASSGQNYIFTK